LCDPARVLNKRKRNKPTKGVLLYYDFMFMSVDIKGDVFIGYLYVYWYTYFLNKFKSVLWYYYFIYFITLMSIQNNNLKKKNYIFTIIYLWLPCFKCFLQYLYIFNFMLRTFHIILFLFFWTVQYLHIKIEFWSSIGSK